MSDQRVGRPRTITRDIHELMTEWAGSCSTWSPSQVFQKLTEKGRTYSLDAVQIAMTRMLHHRELVRVDVGQYQLPDVEPLVIQFEPMGKLDGSGTSVYECSVCHGLVTDEAEHVTWHEEQR